MAADSDVVRSYVSRCDWVSICPPPYELTLEGVEEHGVESHEVLHPVVLDAKIRKRGGRSQGVVGIADRGPVDRLPWPGEKAAVPAPCEGVDLQSIVESVHEDDEEEGGQRISLPHAPPHREGAALSIRCANARGQPAKAVSYELDKRRREVNAIECSNQHVPLNRVVCLLNIVE